MARPRTARFRASAPKGARTGCPRLIFEAGCLVRSAPGPGTADGRGEPDKDDGPVDRRPGERAHRDCAPRAFRGAGRAAKSRAIRGVLSFGDFSLDKQRKVTLGAGRGHPALKLTPPTGGLPPRPGARPAPLDFKK